MKCGLLGRKLGHSYSPAIHALLGDYKYHLFEREPEELEAFLRHGDWDGLNVTMPYKKAVIPFLDQLTDVAHSLGAVNTIYRQNGRLIGHNTDLYGFQQMLLRSGLSVQAKKCLVLGSGGASQVAVRGLPDLGAEVIVISRNGSNNYKNINRHKDAAILVNTTPVGMYPDTGVSPVNLALFPHLEGVLDVIYNPARTQLLLDAEKRGIPAMNGLWMLVAQAKESAERFKGAAIPCGKIAQIHAYLQQQMENIILIGMPGCGKSTIGRLMAEKTGRLFIDTDAEIEKLAQKSIPTIFAEDGEAVFRTLETKVLEAFGKLSGLVIATGGGCVTQERNHPLLQQNGRIFWLQRDMGKLATEGRPLSVNLEEMYRLRRDKYAAFADQIVDNNCDPDATVDQILAYWEERT